MTYLFRVSLPGIKGFYRIYEVNGRNTLYQFHKQMVADMDFPSDQLVLFKAFDRKAELVAKYATFDLGNGSIDKITIESAVKAGITEFTYFYDTVNKKSVIITFEGSGDNAVTLPSLLDSKGPAPEAFLNGYVAFEDLPVEKRMQLEQAAEDGDDFYDDEDEEESDDIFDGDSEDEEEIYSEE